MAKAACIQPEGVRVAMPGRVSKRAVRVGAPCPPESRLDSRSLQQGRHPGGTGGTVSREVPGRPTEAAGTTRCGIQICSSGRARSKEQAGTSWFSACAASSHEAWLRPARPAGCHAGTWCAAATRTAKAETLTADPAAGRRSGFPSWPARCLRDKRLTAVMACLGRQHQTTSAHNRRGSAG